VCMFERRTFTINLTTGIHFPFVARFPIAPRFRCSAGSCVALPFVHFQCFGLYFAMRTPKYRLPKWNDRFRTVLRKHSSLGWGPMRRKKFFNNGLFDRESAWVGRRYEEWRVRKGSSFFRRGGTTADQTSRVFPLYDMCSSILS
jgi:hypothetical protein